MPAPTPCYDTEPPPPQCSSSSPVMGSMPWSCGAGILLLLAGIIPSCRAVTLESIHWSSSNTKFSPGEGLVLYPKIGDKMDIVCPRADDGSPGGAQGGEEEFYRVFLVSRSKMESCSVDHSDTPLLNCDKPHRDVKFTFKFQEFSPNLWGLEFLKGRDYYITSTSTGAAQGLDNAKGGVCKTKSMKLVLRVGQSSSDPPSTLQESPTRFPPTQPKPKDTDVKTKTEPGQSVPGGQEDGGDGGGGGGVDGVPGGLFLWVACGCGMLLLLVIIAVCLVLLWRRYRRRRRAPESHHHTHHHQHPALRSASLPLATLPATKRDSIGSRDDEEGSELGGDVAFPPRPSEGMICRHYERVSTSDYGPPVYIVQEITAQSPTNVYYKV